jgi:hypothetical protein
LRALRHVALVFVFLVSRRDGFGLVGFEGVTRRRNGERHCGDQDRQAQMFCHIALLVWPMNTAEALCVRRRLQKARYLNGPELQSMQRP